jgi:hypothetical protein
VAAAAAAAAFATAGEASAAAWLLSSGSAAGCWLSLSPSLSPLLSLSLLLGVRAGGSGLCAGSCCVRRGLAAALLRRGERPPGRLACAAGRGRGCNKVPEVGRAQPGREGKAFARAGAGREARAAALRPDNGAQGASHAHPPAMRCLDFTVDRERWVWGPGDPAGRPVPHLDLRAAVEPFLSIVTADDQVRLYVDSFTTAASRIQ